MKRLALVCALFAFAATGCVLDAENDNIDSVELGGGTGGHAITRGLGADSSATRIGVVTLDITAGWLNSPLGVVIHITSDNGVTGEEHGTGHFVLSELPVNGDITQGTANVVVDWGTLDPNDTSQSHVYTSCTNLEYADHTLGTEECVGGLVLN